MCPVGLINERFYTLCQDMSSKILENLSASRSSFLFVAPYGLFARFLLSLLRPSPLAPSGWGDEVGALGLVGAWGI